MLRTVPSVEQFHSFVKGLERRPLSTMKQGLPFTVEVVGDAIVYVPSTTKRPRSQPRSRTQMCLDHYEKTGSFNTRGYQKLTANASYFLATLRAYFEASG
ncbi:MAG: hypothetical protein KIS66_00485 [Fimbriimonadaceae bacterium]|nr:hypothetical protein [Fimbriimonadaceae bacterium]